MPYQPLVRKPQALLVLSGGYVLDRFLYHIYLMIVTLFRVSDLQQGADCAIICFCLDTGQPSIDFQCQKSKSTTKQDGILCAYLRNQRDSIQNLTDTFSFCMEAK